MCPHGCFSPCFLHRMVIIRGTETEENILKRLRNARKEMEARDVPGTLFLEMNVRLLANDELLSVFLSVTLITTLDNTDANVLYIDCLFEIVAAVVIIRHVRSYHRQ